MRGSGDSRRRHQRDANPGFWLRRSFFQPVCTSSDPVNKFRSEANSSIISAHSSSVKSRRKCLYVKQFVAVATGSPRTSLVSALLLWPVIIQPIPATSTICASLVDTIRTPGKLGCRPHWSLNSGCTVSTRKESLRRRTESQEKYLWYSRIISATLNRRKQENGGPRKRWTRGYRVVGEGKNSRR